MFSAKTAYIFKIVYKPEQLDVWKLIYHFVSS